MLPEEAVSESRGAIKVHSVKQDVGLLDEDLLLLARLDSGRPLERRPVDVARLCADLVSDAHAAGPDHHWNLDVPPEPLWVSGDDARLHQVIANLLANARVHTPPGTTVTLSLHADANMAVLRVTDDGPGIPAELQPEVFERFARADTSRSHADGSTGLGLAIVKHVAQRHHARLEIDSRVGAGSTFRLRFPKSLVVMPTRAQRPVSLADAEPDAEADADYASSVSRSP
jgi:two-component system OmpR family sensor kinase